MCSSIQSPQQNLTKACQLDKIVLVLARIYNGQLTHQGPFLHPTEASMVKNPRWCSHLLPKTSLMVRIITKV